MTFNNGVSIGYTFQLNEDLTTLAETFVGSSLTYTYGFNNVHQETSRAVTDGTYMWHPGATATTSYGTPNSVNEYPSVGGATYSYDGNGNLKGNGTWTYTYDTENHLISAAKTGTSVSYVYDADHRQIQKTVGSTNSYYVYSGWQRIADYAGSGTGTLQNRYVYGDKPDEALIVVSSAGVLTYLHADRNGSIVATTNSSGAVTNKNLYSPFGEGVPAGSTFGFTGQRYDSDTGLYYYKRRYYNPTIGRFMQPDSIGYTKDLNLYAYVTNDPLNCIDPQGLAAWLLIPFLGIPVYGWIIIVIIVGVGIIWGYIPALQENNQYPGNPATPNRGFSPTQPGEPSNMGPSGNGPNGNGNTIGNGGGNGNGPNGNGNGIGNGGGTGNGPNGNGNGIGNGGGTGNGSIANGNGNGIGNGGGDGNNSSGHNCA